MKRQVNVQVTRRNHTPNGLWDGGVRFEVMETDPLSHLFRGCPMGRAFSENEALRDFCRRANLDDHELSLGKDELVVVERKDYATNRDPAWQENRPKDPPKFKPNDRVILCADEQNDLPEEHGTVLTVDVFDWGPSYVVVVDPQSRVGWADDGLREINDEWVMQKEDERK